MQVMRICSKCGKEYYIDSTDDVELCHGCYQQLSDVVNSKDESITEWMKDLKVRNAVINFLKYTRA
jgi:hypothetical protein